VSIFVLCTVIFLLKVLCCDVSIALQYKLSPSSIYTLSLPPLSTLPHNSPNPHLPNLSPHSTGITKAVYEAAQMLQERLEGLLAPFTVFLADRIERARISNAELQEQVRVLIGARQCFVLL